MRNVGSGAGSPAFRDSNFGGNHHGGTEECREGSFLKILLVPLLSSPWFIPNPAALVLICR